MLSHFPTSLAGLDCWDETRARWDHISQAYRAMLPRGISLTPKFGQDWIASTLSVLGPRDRPDLPKALAAEGIATLSWWGPGCHAQPAFAGYPAEALPVTSIYTRQALGLPFWQDLSDLQIETVCSKLRRILGEVSRKRMPADSLAEV